MQIKPGWLQQCAFVHASCKWWKVLCGNKHFVSSGPCTLHAKSCGTANGLGYFPRIANACQAIIDRERKSDCQFLHVFIVAIEIIVFGCMGNWHDRVVHLAWIPRQLAKEKFKKKQINSKTTCVFCNLGFDS